MYKYNSVHKTNQWKEQLDVLYEDTKTQDSVVEKFTEQLKKDLENLKASRPVSECGYNAPRMSGCLDKKCNVAHDIAYALFPVDPAKDYDEEKTKTYIRYQKVISTLRKAFVDQIEKEDALKNQYKEVKKTHQRKYFCELKHRPISDVILNPVPMPVDVAPIE